MSKTNTLSIKKLTKSAYKSDVLPAFIAYRKAMEAACKVKQPKERGTYSQLFTEKRTRGARSKYWNIGSNLPVNKINKYVAKQPLITTAEGRKLVVYTASYARVKWCPPAFALFCKLVK